MNKLIPLLVFSVLFLIPVGTQDVFANHTPIATGTTGHCDIVANPPVSGVDYSNCDLSGTDLSGTDLSGADLRGADLSGANLAFTNLVGAVLDGQINFAQDCSIGTHMAQIDANEDLVISNISGAGDIRVQLTGSIVAGPVLIPASHSLVFDPNDGGPFGQYGVSCQQVIGGDRSSVTGSVIQVQICGNGIIEVPEQCDDGNNSDNDGCNSLCIFEPLGSVGGQLIPIKSTNLILAGTQLSASWLIPVLVSAVGIGLVLSRKI